jgi:hypothetical protein
MRLPHLFFQILRRTITCLRFLRLLLFAVVRRALSRERTDGRQSVVRPPDPAVVGGSGGIFLALRDRRKA